MRKSSSRILAAFFVILLPAASLGALEVDGSFQIGNIGFTSWRTAADTGFSGLNLFWGADLSILHTLADNFTIQGGFSRDPILGNEAYALVTYSSDYFSLGVGPFLGLFNSAVVLKSGITISARMGIPGVFFVSARTDNSLGGRIQRDGDYAVEATELSAGFYVKNAIFSFDLTSKDFILTQGAQQIVDDLTRYAINVNIYRKNTPMRILISMAYQTVSKEFLDGVTNPTAALNSIVLGAGLDVQIVKRFGLYADFSASVYNWGSGVLAMAPGLGYETFLWEGSAGFRINLDPETPVQ